MQKKPAHSILVPPKPSSNIGYLHPQNNHGQESQSPLAFQSMDNNDFGEVIDDDDNQFVQISSGNATANNNNNNNNNQSNANTKQRNQATNPKKSSLVQNMEKMQQRRDELREKRVQQKEQKLEREQLNRESKRNVDYEFDCLIQGERLHSSLPHQASTGTRKLTVIVRKRPLFQTEEEAGEIDCISANNPIIRVHEGRLRVDGITKYIENHDFLFDNTFSEAETTQDLYQNSLQNVLSAIFHSPAVITCFTYGQTGSGKTYTMRGMQEHYISDLFAIKARNPTFVLVISYFEIYSLKCFDLLNERMQLNVLEDKNNNVQIQNLSEKIVSTPAEMKEVIDQAGTLRQTFATEANEESSRSHAICSITVRDTSNNASQRGKLIMVDLAGSERGQDCQNNAKIRRIEGAEIGKSLLALKECIRAMDSNAKHVPFRSSKLTLILRDSFLNKSPNSRIIMLACISPGSTSADHSVNTLRYADRLKEQSGSHKDVVKIIEERDFQLGKRQIGNNQTSNNNNSNSTSNNPSAATTTQQSQANNSNNNLSKKERTIPDDIPSSTSNRPKEPHISSAPTIPRGNKPNSSSATNGQSKEESKRYDHTQYLDSSKNKENLRVESESSSSIPINSKMNISPTKQSSRTSNHTNSASNSNNNNSNSTNTSRSSQNQRHRDPSPASGIIYEVDEKQMKRQTSLNGKREPKKGADISSNNSSFLQSTGHQYNHQTNQQEKERSAQPTLPKNITTKLPQAVVSSITTDGSDSRKVGTANLASLPASRKKESSSSQVVPLEPVHTTSFGNNANNSNSSIQAHVQMKNKEVFETIERMQQQQQEQKNREAMLKHLKESQEDIFASHMTAIKEDANLLSLESTLLTDCQRDGFMDCDVDAYLKRFENIVHKKLQMYNVLSAKMDSLKKMRQEFAGKNPNQQQQQQHQSTSSHANRGSQHNKDDELQKKRQSYLIKKNI